MWQYYIFVTPKPRLDTIINVSGMIIYVTDKNYILLDTHYFPYNNKEVEEEEEDDDGDNND